MSNGPLEQQKQQVALPIANDNGNNNVHDNDEDNKENPFGPIVDKDGNYNSFAHRYSVERMVERDLTIPAIVEELGPEVCKFVKVVRKPGGQSHILIHHPNPDFELVDGLEWVEKDALSIRNGGKFYKEVSNKRLTWKYLVLKGNLVSHITKVFKEELLTRQYLASDQKKYNAFVKKVAKFIIEHPHESAGTYGCYLMTFMSLIRRVSTDINPISLRDICKSIALEMKNVADYNDKNLPPDQLYKKVRETSTRLSIQQCSKKVHYLIGKIDVDAEKAAKDLDDLDRAAEEELEKSKREAEERLNELDDLLNNPKAKHVKALENAKAIVAEQKKIEGEKKGIKRSIRDVSDGDGDEPEEPPKKIPRIDE